MPPKTEPVAIIGMACRFPGPAKDPGAYWSILRREIDTVGSVPKSRWNPADFDSLHDPATPELIWRGAFLNEDVSLFDADFFRISPREAEKLDTQQRLVRELTWEALERAGFLPASLSRTQTGVFLGASWSDYRSMLMQRDLLPDFDMYAGTGTSCSMLAGRVSHFFGFNGPSLVLDTACSSSLSAVHYACRSLREGESSLAIAGGVHLILAPEGHIYLSRTRALAPDGRCKAFSAMADGYVRGEGAGVVVLKLLSAALRDGDPIQAVIRGSALNHDGRSSGLTVPNGLAQQTVIKDALADAQVRPSDVSYVEAHGTGTRIGDPIEVEALASVYSENRKAAEPLWIGSAKANIGHLEAAAGIAGLIKVVLALNNEELPASLHPTPLSREIAWDNIPVQVVIESRAWRRSSLPRFAGVSAFGISGTNAHVVLQEAPKPDGGTASGGSFPACVLPLSATQQTALIPLAREWRDAIAGAREDSLGDLLYSAAVRRSKHPVRMAAVGRTRDELTEALDSFVRNEQSTNVVSGRGEGTGQIVFVYPGQGSQWLGMGSELMRESPVFRREIERCAEAFSAYTDWQLLDFFQSDCAKQLFERVDVVQPALFALAAGLTRVWQSWGIHPAAAVGHSQGEVVAAYIAGALSLDDAARVVCCRSRALVAHAGRGAMATVDLPHAEVARRIEGRPGVWVAAINGPHSTVITGVPSTISEIVAEVTRQGAFAREVKVDIASHSPQMEEIRDRLLRDLRDIHPAVPSIPIQSTVFPGGLHHAPLDASYWFENIRRPVQFASSIEALLGTGHRLFVEVSAHPILMQPLSETIAAAGVRAAAVSSLRRAEPQMLTMARNLAAVYGLGYPVKWEQFYPDGRFTPAAPIYPFSRQPHWYSGHPASTPAGLVSAQHQRIHRYALAGEFLHIPGEAKHHVLTISVEKFPFLADHVVFGQVVVPGAFHLAAIIAIGREYFGDTAVRLSEVQFVQPLILGTSAELHVMLSPISEGYRFSVYTSEGSASETWREHATGVVQASTRRPIQWASVEEIGAQCQTHFEPTQLFERLSRYSIVWGSQWRKISELRLSADEVLATILPSSYRHSLAPVDPVVIDNCFGTGMAIWNEAGNTQEPHLPFFVESLEVNMDLEGAVHCHWRMRQPLSGSGETTVADFTLIDDLGRVVAQAQGFVAKRAARTAFLSEGVYEPGNDILAMRWLTSSGAEARSELPAGSWLVLSADPGTGKLVSESLRSKGETVTHATLGGEEALSDVRVDPDSPDFERLLAIVDPEGRRITKVVCCWMDHPTQNDPAARAQALCKTALHFAQNCVHQAWRSDLRMWWVTEDAQSTTPEDRVDPAQSALWGMGRVFTREHPEVNCSLVDLGSQDDLGGRIRDLTSKLCGGSGQQELALRAGRTLVPQLVRCSATADARSATTQGACLVTGIGALAQQCARWLIEHKGVSHLVMVARQEPDEPTRAALLELGRHGASIRIEQADVSDAQQVAKLFDGLSGVWQIRGIIHTAGILDDGVILEQNTARLSAMFAPKVQGAWLLHMQTLRLSLDFFILFSSASAVIGGEGQCTYAAANAFMDGIAHLRRHLGLPALTLNWGLWSGGGMGSMDDAGLRRFQTQGFLRISPEQGVELLDRAAGMGESQLVPIRLDLGVLRERNKTDRLPLVLQTMIGDSERSSRDAEELVNRLKSITLRERSRILRRVVQAEVLAVMSLAPGTDIPAERPFQEFGLDSLMALQLRRRLSRILSLKLPPTAVFDYPTIEALCGYLSDALPRRQTPEDGADGSLSSSCASGVSSAANLNAAEPIAVIGQSCRFPSAEDPTAFWKALMEGRDMVSEIGNARWPLDSDSGQAPMRYAGLLNRPEEFDAHFFGISDHEATSIDPQHRLILEVTWEALENAGLSARRLAGTRTGVFVGICTQDYLQQVIECPPATFDAYSLTGIGNCFSSGRLSHILGLQGPSMAIDTACSSSLVAVHLACESLLRGDSELALAGGVNLILSPITMELIEATRGLSPDGRCKAFDADANGFVRAEGCGIVALKRLSRALEDGDPILAVLRATGINQDGRSASLSAPNLGAQRDLIRSVLDRAGVSPEDIGYIEAHGTGTAIGDPIEMGALCNVFGARRDGSQCLVGSVKTNIGHAEAAAGIAGLIKTILALQHEAIPRQLHFKRLNPLISLESSCLEIASSASPWRRNAKPRIACVSSFGMSGTNAHAVVAEAPDVSRDSDNPGREIQLLTLSAKSSSALIKRAYQLSEWISTYSDQSLADICLTANCGRDHFEHRAAFIVTTVEQAHGKLASFGLNGELSADTAGHHRDAGKVAFQFSNETAGLVNRIRKLYAWERDFREAFENCANLLDKHLAAPFADSILNDHSNTMLSFGVLAPALFAFQTSLYQLWTLWGIFPDIVAGCGIGELAAQVTTGAIPKEDACRLLAALCRSWEASSNSTPSGSPELASIAAGILPSVPTTTAIGTGPSLLNNLTHNTEYWFADSAAQPFATRLLEAYRDLQVETVVQLGIAGSAVQKGTCSGGDAPWWTPSSNEDDTSLYSELSQLYVRGFAIDWQAFHKGYAGRRISLPTYPFERRRYWLDVALKKPTYQPVGIVSQQSLDPVLEEHPTAARKETRVLTPTEERLSAMCCELIEVDEIDTRAEFFAIGGDSLLATRLVARIREELQVNIGLELILDSPSIHDIAEAIDEIRLSSPLSAETSGSDRISRRQSGSGLDLTLTESHEGTRR